MNVRSLFLVTWLCLSLSRAPNPNADNHQPLMRTVAQNWTKLWEKPRYSKNELLFLAPPNPDTGMCRLTTCADHRWTESQKKPHHSKNEPLFLTPPNPDTDEPQLIKVPHKGFQESNKFAGLFFHPEEKGPYWHPQPLTSKSALILALAKDLQLSTPEEENVVAGSCGLALSCTKGSKIVVVINTDTEAKKHRYFECDYETSNGKDELDELQRNPPSQDEQQPPQNAQQQDLFYPYC